MCFHLLTSGTKVGWWCWWANKNEGNLERFNGVIKYLRWLSLVVSPWRFVILKVVWGRGSPWDHNAFDFLCNGLIHLCSKKEKEKNYRSLKGCRIPKGGGYKGYLKKPVGYVQNIFLFVLLSIFLDWSPCQFAGIKIKHSKHVCSLGEDVKGWKEPASNSLSRNKARKVVESNKAPNS